MISKTIQMIYNSKICIVIISVIGLFTLLSCNHEEYKYTLEDKVISGLILREGFSKDSTIIIKNRQGIFSYDTLISDTLSIGYNGWYIGNLMGIDSVSMLDGIYDKGAPQPIMHGSYLRTTPLIDMYKIEHIDFMDEFIKQKTPDNNRIYLFDWTKLHDAGIRDFITISELVINQKYKYGLIGYQVYSEDNLEQNSKLFDYNDSLIFVDFVSRHTRPLDYICGFRGDSLVIFGTNSEILK